MENDVNELKAVFEKSSDIVYRELHIGNKKGMLIFLDGLVNQQLMDSDVLKPLLNWDEQELKAGITSIKQLLERVVTTADATSSQKLQDVTDHILSGNTVLLIDKMPDALFISIKGWEKRAIEQPESEVVVRGPRDGFTENLRTNTSLIRRRLKTPRLKMEQKKVGRLSKTDLVITYIEGIAEDSLVQEIHERIDRIDIDAILESGYIEELIDDNPFSVFPLVGHTERPDKVVGSLLEGSVGIIIDNTPFCLIAPQTFFQLIQSPEDYYQRYITSSFIRMLRYLFLIISLLLPSLYVAVTTFHQEMLPTSLLLSLAVAREATPFPALIEALIMEVAFEGLREAGVRLPRAVGSAVSIVGALVIGQAAVDAGIVSSPMVIIVATTGIASFIIPGYEQANTIRILRFPMMFLAGFMGLYGVFLGVITLQIYILRLRSFGVPYFSPVAPLDTTNLKDIFVRAPWWAMNKRPGYLGKNKANRIKHNSRPGPNQ